MPVFIAAAVMAGAVSGTIAAGALAFSMSAFTTSLVLGGLSYAMQKKPQQQQAASFSAQGRMVTIRQPITPWQIIVGQPRAAGAMTFAYQSTDKTYFHIIITLAGHICEEITTIYFDGEEVPLDGSGNATGRFAGYVRIKKSLGDEAGQPFSDLVAESDGKWTDAHRQTGRTKIYVRLKANRDLFPNGVPNITTLTKGAKIYDSRTTLTAWSDNAALWVANYLTNTTYGLGAVYADEMDDADAIASANICDEIVSLSGGGSEARYRVNGTFSLSEQPKVIIGHLLAQMAGKAVNAGDKWHIYAGAYSTPTITIDEGDLAGPISVQSLVSRRESCNGVKGVFVDPNSSWQPTDFPPIASDTYMAEDGGQRVWKDIDLTAFGISGTQSQRLAKIELLKTRQGLTASMKCKLTALQAMTGRTVAVNNTKLGWAAKPFDVVSSNFAIAADGTLGVQLGLRETGAAVFDWSTSEEQTVDIAPNTNLPSPFDVGAPTGIVLSSGTTELLMATDGTVITRIKVAWDTPTVNNSVREAQIQYKKTSDTDWMDASPVKSGTGPVWLSPIDDGLAYDVRLRYENSIGVRGAWVTAGPHTAIGKTAVPSDVASLTATASADRIVLSWPEITDADRDFYEVRLGAVWASATLVGKIRATSLKLLPPETGNYTWLIKAVDTTGNYSTNATSASVTTLAPTITSFTQQVVDNNVLLYWVGAAGTLAIETYELRKGSTWAGATLIGKKSGGFTTVFETVGDTYTYWIAAIDSAGNYGTPTSISATVSQPPDYILNADYDSTLNGTLSSAALSNGTVVLPVNTTETFAQHFTVGHTWAGPDDQIAAGYPIFAQPAAASGYYEEEIDYGSTLAASKITVALNSQIIAGSPGVTMTISTATAAAPTVWTDYVGVTEVYATNFRYVKIHIAVTSTGVALLQIVGINTRLDAKLKNDAGSVACLSTDAGGTTVTFAQTFSAVTSITVSPQGTSVVIPVYDFAGGANPTTFKILLFNAAGTRVSGDASWSAKGY